MKRLETIAARKSGCGKREDFPAKPIGGTAPEISQGQGGCLRSFPRESHRGRSKRHALPPGLLRKQQLIRDSFGQSMRTEFPPLEMRRTVCSMMRQGKGKAGRGKGTKKAAPARMSGFRPELRENRETFKSCRGHHFINFLDRLPNLNSREFVLCLDYFSPSGFNPHPPP